MNGVLMPLLLTLDKYLFCTKYLSLEIITLARYNILQAMPKPQANSILDKGYYEFTNPKWEHS